MRLLIKLCALFASPCPVPECPAAALFISAPLSSPCISLDSLSRGCSIWAPVLLAPYSNTRCAAAHYLQLLLHVFGPQPAVTAYTIPFSSVILPTVKPHPGNTHHVQETSPFPTVAPTVTPTGLPASPSASPPEASPQTSSPPEASPKPSPSPARVQVSAPTSNLEVSIPLRYRALLSLA